MSSVRAFEGNDIPAVAAMFQRLFRKKPLPPPASLSDYMRRFYLEAPGCGVGVGSLVHVNDEGRVSGFIGVHVLPMTFNGRKLRAAICSSLMSVERAQDPLAGARLLKAFLDAPQDLSFSETANEMSVQLWTRLRGTVLPQYSLDWVRVIRPASFTLNLASDRVGLAAAFRPLALVVDAMRRKQLTADKRYWSALPAGGGGHKGYRTQEIGDVEFARLLEPFTSQYALRPDWGDCPLDRILADAAQRPDLGELVFASVVSSSGAQAGAFAYHVKPRGIGAVLQVLARPGQAGHVIDCLVDDAAERGLCGLRGRVQPALLEAMLPRRIAFVPVASTVAHSRDAELIQAITNSQAFLNGIAGEQWSRLIGGRFA